MGLPQKKQRVIISVVSSYWCVLLLAPYYHAHPGEDHEHASGSSYHTHPESSDAHASEEEVDQDAFFSDLLSQISSPVVHRLVQSKPGWNVKLQSSKPSIEPDKAFTGHRTPFKYIGSLIAPQLREWYVQFATNLSPPQA